MRTPLSTLLLSAFLGPVLHAQVPVRTETPASLPVLPVREVTVFKDGHAFVLHRGELPTDPSGNVVLDRLPAPVIGTFWPFTSGDAKLRSVVAGRKRVKVRRTAVTLQEMLQANTGAAVVITEKGGRSYPATIVGIPGRAPDDDEERARPNPTPRGAQTGSVLLLQAEEGGVKSLPMDRVEDVVFKDAFKPLVEEEEIQDLLTLRLDWGGKPAAKSAPVGMMYVQKGIRWIPAYRITIDGNGKAAVELEATLLNELEDLDDVTVNLVIGVPTVLFKDTLDPMALEESLARLSSYFQDPAQTASAFSNAIRTQTQMSRTSEYRGRRTGDDQGGAGGVPELSGDEDLFVFTVEHLSLKRGERMVLPVARYELAYKDVYTLDLPFAPPPDIRRTGGSSTERELAKLLEAPRVQHKLRLENSSRQPLTTAPALILKGNRVLAQGLMTYTAPGASSDLAVTSAVDISVRRSDAESGRTPNAVRWQGAELVKVSLEGKITLTSFRGEPIDLEVTRHLLGNVDRADAGGAITRVSVFDAEDSTAFARPAWWSTYNWPSWWHHLNGTSRVDWKLRLEPGKPVDLAYGWHYYWN